MDHVLAAGGAVANGVGRVRQLDRQRVAGGDIGHRGRRHQFDLGARVTWISADEKWVGALYGTNLTDEDWERLEEQRLSPLYLSVHATEPALRRSLLNRADNKVRNLTHVRRYGFMEQADSRARASDALFEQIGPPLDVIRRAPE